MLILIVDDDPGFRRALHLALDSHGYDVCDASDGAEALETQAERAPDLVVLDWHLPGRSGIETCRELRARYQVPVIMMSGNRTHRRENAVDAGASDYLTKPFSVNDLVHRIETALHS